MSPRNDGIRTDDEIAVDVRDNLRWDARVNADTIEVTVDSGIVWLKGGAPTYTARAAAVEQARHTPGARDVRDEIQVAVKHALDGQSDEEIRERAEKVLQWDASLDGSDIQASVRRGVLELEGNVDQHWKMLRARDLVMGIRGVVEVRENLAVVPTRTVADEVLAEEITSALARNVLIDEDRVDVRVENGVVTLTGTVASWMEVDTVEEIVSATPGALEIRNQLDMSLDEARR
jgi:osmotically-inducible protein OsmY